MTCSTRSFFLRGLLIIAGLVVARGAPAAQKHFSATNLWTVNVGYYVQSSPALDANGVIYVTSWDGRLLAINSDGSRRWVFKTGCESVSSPAIGTDGTIFFGARNRRIYAVDAAGRKQWDFKTGGWVDASPALGTDGTIYLGSWDKKFYALNPAGQKQWEFPTGGPIVSSAAINSEGVIYFGSHDRKFYALNPDGSKRWEFASGGAITASPAIGSEGEIYFSSVDGKLYALNSDGSRRWALQTGGITPSSPVLDAAGNVYLSVNQTHCAVTPDGKLRWQQDFWHPQPGGFGESTAAALADNTVVFMGRNGYVMTVPAEDGAREFVWNFWLYGPTYSSPLVAPNGTIYVLGQSLGLQALHREVPLVKSTWPTFRGNSQRTGRVTAGP
jgi:outer membrane protein assembly factor BamB